MYYIMSMSLILVWFQRAMHAQISDLILYTYENHGNFSKKNSLENPVDRGAWWAAVHGVAQSRTQLKWLSMHACIGEGNGNPLQCSCLETPRDGGAWRAAIYGVAQSRTQLKWLSSSSSIAICDPKLCCYTNLGTLILPLQRSIGASKDFSVVLMFHRFLGL